MHWGKKIGFTLGLTLSLMIFPTLSLAELGSYPAIDPENTTITPITIEDLPQSPTRETAQKKPRYTAKKSENIRLKPHRIAKKTTPASKEALQTRIRYLEKQVKRLQKDLKIARSTDNVWDEGELSSDQVNKDDPRWKYDPVPSDQVDSIAKRLKIAQIILTKHARAYDYRTHTTNELQEVLDQLDSQSGDQGNTNTNIQ